MSETTMMKGCKEMAPHSSILAWKIPRTEGSLVGYSPWGCNESDMTEGT